MLDMDMIVLAGSMNSISMNSISITQIMELARIVFVGDVIHL